MTNYHVIGVRYFGATNHRGSRVRLTSDRFKESVFVPFNYSLNNVLEMAAEYLTSKGFEIIGAGQNEIITVTFKGIR